MGAILNNKSRTTEQLPQNEQQTEINFTGQFFTLDSAVVKTQNLVSLRGGYLTCPKYHQRKLELGFLQKNNYNNNPLWCQKNSNVSK